MSKCCIEVITQGTGLSIWCDTCKEHVAWSRDFFTLDEVTATAKGHLKVMKRCRKIEKGINP